MYFAIPDDERLFVDKSREDRLVLTGLQVRLNPEQVIAGRALIVRATEVEIDGHLKLPAGRVDIFARRIVAHPGATIDVSGATGEPDYTGRAPALPGTGPGASGKAGNNGGDGGHGGSITLVAEAVDGSLRLWANGGAGGAAQSGGNGIKGASGNAHVKCNPPTQGKPGGNAGPAGRPGRGGNGGQIAVTVLQPLADEQIQCLVTAGKAGAPGNHGKAGAGGDGGRGGSEGKWIPEICVR